MTHVLRGKTLGIVGLGHVGRYVAKIAKAFEMNVLAWGPRLTQEAAALAGTESRELDDLLRSSDIVSVHATLSPESRGLIDARRLALMKPTAYLINTARGPIVDEPALCAALANGRIAGAGLDVFDEEPLPPAHPLTKLPNVVLTPHIGWPTDEMYRQFADAAADALLGYLDGQGRPSFRRPPLMRRPDKFARARLSEIKSGARPTRFTSPRGRGRRAIARRVRGYRLSRVTCPLTPALSPQGRGSAPSQ